MYERFSKRVEEVIKLANRFAREYDLDYVGTEHILLAIRCEGSGVGSSILEALGVDQDRLKQEIDRLIKKSMEDTWVFGRLPGTPHFRNVIATAIEEAGALSSKEVCTEHLLLSLLKEEGSVAQQALRALGCQYADVREEILKRTSQETEDTQ